MARRSARRAEPTGRVRPLSWDRGASRRARSDAGISSLQMAILFPTVLLIVLSMFQIALYWHTANAAAVAAEQGVDAGQIHAEDERRARAEAQAAGQWILDTVNHRNGTVVPAINGNLLTVTVTAESPRIIGFGTWRVRSVAEGRMEEFVPADQR